VAAVTVLTRPKITSIATDQSADTGNASTVPVVTVELDASVTETHSLANTVTDHPVEDGVNVSDHSRPEPDALTIEGIVSNTPFSTSTQTRAVNSGSVTFDTTSEANVPRDQPGYAEEAYRKLRQLRDEGVLCTVVTTLRTYTSMAITSVSVPRDSKTYDALRFSITFKRVVVVKNKLTRTRVSRDSRAGDKTKTGNQATKNTEVEKSRLAAAVDGAAGKDGFLGKTAGFARGGLGL
jgi:hypothetical protein